MGGGGGGGMLSVEFCPDTKSGGGGGGGGGRWYDRVSGGPGYSTVVQFMCTGINRQRKRAANTIKCCPKSYEFIYGGDGGGGGGGGHVPRVPPGSAAGCKFFRDSIFPVTPAN